MAAASLTRGGFCNHFKTKGELFVEALDMYAQERREDAPKDFSKCGPEVAKSIFDRYVSRQLLDTWTNIVPLSLCHRTWPAQVQTSEKPTRGSWKPW